MWVDAHCHIDFEAFSHDRESVLRQAQAKDILHISIPGIEPSQWQIRDALVKDLSCILPEMNFHIQYGVHPFFISKLESETHNPLQTSISLLEHNLAQDACAWIGEVGLDALIKNADYDIQKQYFEAQLSMAKTYKRPVVLHARKAHQDIFQQIKKTGFHEGGLVHAFSGSKEIAKQYVDRGFVLGVGGAMTYANATKIQSALQEIPLKHLVLETDSPDMPPAFIKRTNLKPRNTPLSIPDIGQALADLKKISLEEVQRVTTQNALRFLRAPERPY